MGPGRLSGASWSTSTLAAPALGNPRARKEGTQLDEPSEPLHDVVSAIEGRGALGTGCNLQLPGRRTRIQNREGRDAEGRGDSCQFG